MYRISAIIPVRNREGLVEQAIRSVLAQTYPVFEIVVVDDGSTDNTPSTVARLAKEDPRIRLVRHASSRRAQAARNSGIRAAAGNWVAFLDSDDQWLPNSLELRVQVAMKNHVQVVHSACYVLRANSSELKSHQVPAMEGRIYHALLRRQGPVFPSLLVSKESIVRIGLLDESILAYQEWDTAIRLAKHYEFGFVSEPTFIYNCTFGDSMSRNGIQGAKGYEQVFTKHAWSIFRLLGPKELSGKYEEAAELYSLADDKKSARRCLMKAFLLSPVRILAKRVLPQHTVEQLRKIRSMVVLQSRVKD